MAEDNAPDMLPQMPVRMLNEFTYCPRLFYLEWVQGEFADNAFTLEGNLAHRRVDQGGGVISPPEGGSEFRARAVELSSVSLGLSAKIDLVDGVEGEAIPVDYKRGSVPPGGVPFEPEQIQLCAYGLLLREAGYRCERGYLYFVESKKRVEVAFTDALVARTQELLTASKRTAKAGKIPAPLRNSPKCEGCSLNGICLPDEVNLLEARAESPSQEGEVRPLVTERNRGRALYIQLQGAKVGLEGGTLMVTSPEREVVATARLFELSELVIWGNVSVSAQAIRELCDREIPICWLTYGGWFSGMTEGLGSKNIELRRAQFRAAADGAWALRLGRRFVSTKIANCRTLLRRNHRGSSENVLRSLNQSVESAESADSLQALLGIEGSAARAYFGEWPHLLRPTGASGDFELSLEGRNRRPPRDPVNALLSFTYSMLTREVTVSARRVGLDPFLGFYHQPRFGRPALALDLMEEFRPILADSVVLNVINTGVVTSTDFVRSHLGVALKADARKRLLKAWDRRMTEEITHPVFGYRLSYRRVLEVQCRLLGRHLLGELENYPEFKTR